MHPFHTHAEQYRILTTGTRAEVMAWNQWNDKNGDYDDEYCTRLNQAPWTIEQLRYSMLLGMDLANSSAAQALAFHFSRILRSWHTPEQMAEVIARNAAETHPTVCHSHDFYDANQAMLDAMESLGMEFQDAESEPESQYNLINRAWDIAKAAEFNQERITLDAFPVK